MVTLTDVAARAGVSASTVSYVISGKRPISHETRDRVLQAVADLGYHPHASARALASHRSNVIAMMVPPPSDMCASILMETALTVVAAAHERGRDVLLLTGDEGGGGVRRIAASGLADAVILLDVERDDARITVLRETALPAVVIGCPDSTADLTCVDLDFAAAGAACADHLADLGHRRIALIGADAGVYRRPTGFAARTLEGFLRRSRQRGLAASHHPCGPSFGAAAQLIGCVLAENPDTSGFVVQNEAVAGLLPHLLRQCGKAVPEDASVIAFCPEWLALQAVPQLSAIAVPAQELGRRAVALTLAELAGLPTGGMSLIPPHLVVRQSSKRPRTTLRTAA